MDAGGVKLAKAVSLCFVQDRNMQSACLTWSWYVMVPSGGEDSGTHRLPWWCHPGATGAVRGGRGAAYSCFEPFSASISGMFRASALAHFPLEVEKGTGVSFIMKGFFSVRGWPSPRKWSQCQFLVCSRTSLHMSRGSNTLLHAISGPFSALHGFHFWMLFCFFVC
jgi:hypothetical protein